MSDDIINPIFSALVDDENDIVGLIAYSLYKNDKKEWIEEFHQKQANSPDKSQINLFVSGAMTNGNLTRLQEAAEERLLRFSDVIYLENKDKLTEEIQTSEVSELIKNGISDIEEKLSKNFKDIKKEVSDKTGLKNGIYSSLIAAAVYSILGAGLYFTFGSDDSDVGKVIDDNLPQQEISKPPTK